MVAKLPIRSLWPDQLKWNPTRKNKGKGQPITGHEAPGWEQMYSSTLSLTSPLDGVGGQRHALADLPPRKDPVPIVQEAG